MEWPWTPETVYLGGGTPSLLEENAFARIMQNIPGAPWHEATIEAAPGGLSLQTVRHWKRGHINRVSFGTQSFVKSELARTGRRHTPEIVEEEVALLREAGIDSINVDLIAGLPGQTRSSWGESLDWVAQLEVPHVSVYMLEVDQDSRLGNELILGGRRYGAGDVPTDDHIAEFYEIAVERLKQLGIHRYEISNFARTGFESAHNLKYWRREPYLGFGADAHSYDGEQRWQNSETAAEYVAENKRLYSPADHESERFFLGLRLSEGIAGDFGPWQANLERWIENGLLERAGDRVRLTNRGVLLSNEVFADFVSHKC